MKTNIKRRTYQTKHRKNTKAKWLLLAFFTINALTALTVPYTLDVIYPTNQSYPQAHVVKQVVKAEDHIRDTTKMVETTKEEITRIAKEYCTEKGLGDYCWKDLVGIAHNEQHDFNCYNPGDHNQSYGCFQIHRGFHPDVTLKQALDNNFAVKWTLNRLISKGYPVMRSYAIMAHNGTPGIPATKAYLNAVNEYIKSL